MGRRADGFAMLRFGCGPRLFPREEQWARADSTARGSIHALVRTTVQWPIAPPSTAVPASRPRVDEPDKSMSPARPDLPLPFRPGPTRRKAGTAGPARPRDRPAGAPPAPGPRPRTNSSTRAPRRRRPSPRARAWAAFHRSAVHSCRRSLRDGRRERADPRPWLLVHDNPIGGSLPALRATGPATARHPRSPRPRARACCARATVATECASCRNVCSACRTSTRAARGIAATAWRSGNPAPDAHGYSRRGVTRGSSSAAVVFMCS